MRITRPVGMGRGRVVLPGALEVATPADTARQQQAAEYRAGQAQQPAAVQTDAQHGQTGDVRGAALQALHVEIGCFFHGNYSQG